MDGLRFLGSFYDFGVVVEVFHRWIPFCCSRVRGYVLGELAELVMQLWGFLCL